MQTGKLYIVPTPIGNLKDITFRGIETLKSSDFILAEDTRHTGKLLKEFQIESKMVSYHQHNEHKQLNSLISQLKNGAIASLVPDAGTPGISDPGYLIVRECLKNGIDVECLPGATALIPALVVSGFPCDTFCFEGFLPQKKGRNKRLSLLIDEKRTMVFYESPHRLLKTLQQFGEQFGAERKVSVSRELTKLYEEIKRGSIQEIIEYFTDKTIKGEIVIVIEGKQK